MKRKHFLITWLAVFLLAPSVWIHRFFMYQMPPPGSDMPGPPLFVPFGGVYFIGQLWGQLIRGDFADSLAIFLVLILPILIYTFALSLVIYHLGRYFLRKLREKRSEKALAAAP